MELFADVGFKNYDEIIKAISLGADYVMLGSIINKSIESCGDNYLKRGNDFTFVNQDDAIESFNNGDDVYKLFRGMSTKDVQRKWGNKIIKTSEGIIKYNKVEYSISGWIENFKHYLKTSMSYQDKLDIKNFVGNSEYIYITENSYRRFNK